MFDERWSSLAEPVFRRIGNESEFSGSLAIAQDPDGFIWVGTQRGLIRWDGYRSRTFNVDVNDPSALHDTYISVLYVDDQGSLWIGTRSSGLAKYDRTSDRFVTYPVGHGGFPYPLVEAITGDHEGHLWVATGSGDGPASVDRLTIATGEIQTLTSSSDGSQARPRSLLIDGDGTLWIGSHGGLLRCEKKIACRSFELPRATQVHALHESDDGTLWIGTLADGVYYAHRGSISAQHLDSAAIHAEVFDFVEPVPGELWIASVNGLFVVEMSSEKVRTVRHNRAVATSLPEDLAVKLYRDRSGLIWIGLGAGLATYDPQAAILTIPSTAIRPEGVADTWINVLFPAANGTIWAGTASEGIYLIDPKSDHPRHLAPAQLHSQVSGVAETHGSVFVVDDDGLARASSDGSRIERFTIRPHGITGDINDLFIKNDTVWLLGLDGVWFIDRRSAIDGPVTRAAFSDRLTDQVASASVWETPTRLWLGTRNGLNRLDTDTNAVKKIMAEPGNASALQSGQIKTMLMDKNHRLWVGTAAGLHRMNSTDADHPTFESVRLGDLRPPLVVLAALQGNDGALWISTIDGLVTVDPETLATRVLQRADGVVNTFSTDGAACATPQGELLFGGIDGITAARPDRLKPWDFQAPIVVTDIRIGDEHVLPSHHIAEMPDASPLNVAPDAGGLSVEFAALDYSAPDRNRYAYRLDGFDRDWINSDANVRTASYTDLPPGEFTLRLRGSNRVGLWSNREIAIPIHVLPHWYQSKWALASYAVLFIASLWLAGAWRVRRAERATRILENTVAERTAALASANAQLDDARRAAEAATEAKSAFLANMSHEIRTPMNAVLGFAQLGLRQPLPPKALDYFGKVVNAGKNLLRIINDILDFSKIESGKLVLENIPFDVRRLLDEVRELFSMKAAEQRLDFSISCDADVPERLVGDPLRLNQVLINLIGNALKFTRAGYVRVNVTTRKRTDDAQMLRFAIEDSGVGMNDAQRARLFMPFSQADSSTTRVFGGTGLGLTISQRIVEQMGGRIEVKSDLGKGSVFVFDASFGFARDTVADTKIEDPTNRSLERSSGTRVLLAEDNPINQQLVIEILGDAGMSVIVAASGDEAVALAMHESFDCILMDIQMPGLDGYAATARIRENAARSGIPIIAMTAHASAAFRAECLAAGMNDYLTKPIDARTLIETVSRWTTTR